MARLAHFQVSTLAGASPTVSMHSFTLFLDLPIELRRIIWRLAVERQRIIFVRLENPWSFDSVLAKQGETRPKTHEKTYDVIVEGFQTINKLFRVSRESREAAMAFYRAHIPCWFFPTTGKFKNGILYFNPEHDFLHLANESCIPNSYVDFLYDLKTTYDPCTIGLLNLAIKCRGLVHPDGLCHITTDNVSPEVRSSFIETLAQLCEVFLVQIQKSGRYASCRYEYSPPYLRGSRIDPNLSIPVKATTPNFDRLPVDPRLIGGDLCQVPITNEGGPEHMIRAWAALIRRTLGGDAVSLTNIRVLLSFSPAPFFIDDQQAAEKWLEKDQEAWLEGSGEHEQWVLVISSEDL
ncbi:hypothetical protein Hte_012002 [Hypoxylon texense]